MADALAGGKLAYKGRSKGQAILKLIGSYAGAEWPLSLYLTDGTVWHRLALYPKELVYWGDLTTREAMHCMVSELKKVKLARLLCVRGACLPACMSWPNPEAASQTTLM